jgi:uncharacterized protein
VIASPSIFFALVFALSVPFYLLGVFGARLPGLPILPASALMTFVPITAALILVFQRRGAGGVAASAQHMLTTSRLTSARWNIIALLFLPAICVIEFGVLRLTGYAVPFPDIRFGDTLLFFAAFFIGAIGEEAGWQGYAYPALRSRHSALISAVVLGTVWALWHIIPFVQLGRSVEWIVWHSLNAIALRIIMIWLFERSGKSILIIVLFHTMINLSWALFPIAGSYYSPFVTFILLAISVGVIVLLWWPALGCRNFSG